jgi:hypothetical protein
MVKWLIQCYNIIGSNCVVNISSRADNVLVVPNYFQFLKKLFQVFSVEKKSKRLHWRTKEFWNRMKQDALNRLQS